MAIAICPSQSAKSESDSKQGFQSAQTPIFSTKNAPRRQVKRRNTPQYLKNATYSKSIQQYQRERKRRRIVVELVRKGLTFDQIAKQLGVSTMTVKRDLAKVQPYMKGQISRKRRLLEQQRQKEIEAMPAETRLQTYRQLAKLLFRVRKLSKKEQFEQHNKTIFIDFDNPTQQGLPNFRFDKDNSTFKTPYKLKFMAIKNRQFISLAAITIS